MVWQRYTVAQGLKRIDRRAEACFLQRAFCPPGHSSAQPCCGESVLPGSRKPRPAPSKVPGRPVGNRSEMVRNGPVSNRFSRRFLPALRLVIPSSPVLRSAQAVGAKPFAAELCLLVRTARNRFPSAPPVGKNADRFRSLFGLGRHLRPGCGRVFFANNHAGNRCLREINEI